MLLAATTVGVLFGAIPAAPAHADRVVVRVGDHHDRYERERIIREREYARRHRDWRDHGRVYYGERVYVAPPPVVYAPPPPPSGLNLLFSFGR